jgi:drug/metabolite transporter (DMT)-like permease
MVPCPRSSRRATLLGFGAVGMWALLALLTAAAGPVPPFQLLALTFAIGGTLGVVLWLFGAGSPRDLKQPPRVWALGVGGLFGYHALYFAALKLAPPADANLVNYLWPLLIVLLSALLPGERLRVRHLAGALLGLGGVVALFAGRADTALSPDHLAGYACALAGAVVWAGYSVLSRLFGRVPTGAVTGFCLATAALGLGAHLLLEQTRWPSGWSGGAAIVLGGLGPVGAAFYLWDIGMKGGDIRLLAVGAYAIPVLSTLLLVAAGYAGASGSLALACAAIVSGALVASVPTGKSSARTR